MYSATVDITNKIILWGFLKYLNKSVIFEQTMLIAT